jgi:hypothetical protein
MGGNRVSTPEMWIQVPAPALESSVRWALHSRRKKQPSDPAAPGREACLFQGQDQCPVCVRRNELGRTKRGAGMPAPQWTGVLARQIADAPAWPAVRRLIQWEAPFAVLESRVSPVQTWERQVSCFWVSWNASRSWTVQRRPTETPRGSRR